MMKSRPICGSPECTLPISATTSDSNDRQTDFQIITSLLWVRSESSKSPEPVNDGSAIATASVRHQVERAQKPARNVRVRANLPDLGLLRFHQDRLMAAVEGLGWDKSPEFGHIRDVVLHSGVEIEKHLVTLSPVPPGTLDSRKLRILINRDGQLQIDSTSIGHSSPVNQNTLLATQFIPGSFDDPSASDAEPCKVWIDQQATEPSVLTIHKTTHRCMYSDARNRAGLTPQTPLTAQEVLLYNAQDEVTETSACTVYFNRDGIWLTPSSHCGPNLGVTRRLALSQGLCAEGAIRLLDLQVGEQIWLSNAVRGFFRGVLQPDMRLS